MSRKIQEAIAKFWQQASRIGAIVLLCWVFSCQISPAFAATRISPRLEEQILQVIRQHPEVIVESVQAYQQQQQQQYQQQQQALVQDLFANPKKLIGTSPVLGADDAKVLLVEFSDFQCPYCAEARQTLEKFIDKHSQEVKLVYKHFPLVQNHPEAMAAAQAAVAAGKQGKFWQYHDALFSHQDKLGEEFYLATAKDLDLDLEQFDRDRQAASAAIAEDMRLAERLGISGTPFFVINGKAFTGAPQLADLEKLLASDRQS